MLTSTLLTAYQPRSLSSHDPKLEVIVCKITTVSILGRELDKSTLQLVQIYFDTATFDDIERDKKIKTEAQLSLIGGTMGLLTGFSIISGVEIIFFLSRLITIFKKYWKFYF